MHPLSRARRARARRCRHLFSPPLWLSLLLLSLGSACTGSHPPGSGDGGAGCPGTAPAAGEACAAPHLRCTYERCATVGVVSAQCTPGDGGAASWSVASRACPDTCGGAACAPGTVCAQRISGALLHECRAHSCGDGPLDCACACGPGVECTISGGADDAVFGCIVGCGAAICP